MAFHIGLNMAGAVSAGAYTAGVLDFLVDALDTWYAAKASGANVPQHDVVLDVMSGASAGGMCAAISAVALQENFPHVRAARLDASEPTNRLYWGWVEAIDISGLLGTADLAGGNGLRSFLDSSPIASIASTALKPDPAKRCHRAWVSPEMHIILTLTNLRGVPYSVDESNAGSFEERIAYHADRIEFAISDDATDGPTTYGLSYRDSSNANWTLLQTAAMATGAFPLMLAGRTIERRRSEYEQRLWDIQNAQPGADGGCTSKMQIEPAWDSAAATTFVNPYVDGGMTNNNPFECARQFIAQRAGNVNGHNPRDGRDANAAVLSVAPFPGTAVWDRTYDPTAQIDLHNIIMAFVNSLVDQSRFQGEELALIRDPNVFSRFAISPDDGVNDPNRPALLCGALGAFGGFVDRAFREHDYQLGRRNCQQFLRAHFTLPGANPLINRPDAPDQQFPIIPLMPEVAAEIPLPDRASFCTTQERIDEVADAAGNRAKAVLHALAAKKPLWSGLINAALTFGGAEKIKNSVSDYLTQGLAGQIS